MADPITIEFEFKNKRFLDAKKGLDALAADLQTVWDGGAAVLRGELLEMMKIIEEALKKRHGGAWPGGTTDNTLSKRTGRLTRGIRTDAKGDTFDTVQGTIALPFPAGVHEFGATITPKKSKYLTVPLPASMDKRGVPLKKSARDWKNTFIAMSKKGNLIIFQKSGKKVVPLYVLKSEVKIKPRLGVRKTIETAIPYFVDEATDALLKNMLTVGSASAGAGQKATP